MIDWCLPGGLLLHDLQEFLITNHHEMSWSLTHQIKCLVKLWPWPQKCCLAHCGWDFVWYPPQVVTSHDIKWSFFRYEMWLYHVTSLRYYIPLMHTLHQSKKTSCSTHHKVVQSLEHGTYRKKDWSIKISSKMTLFYESAPKNCRHSSGNSTLREITLKIFLAIYLSTWLTSRFTISWTRKFSYHCCQLYQLTFLAFLAKSGKMNLNNDI